MAERLELLEKETAVSRNASEQSGRNEMAYFGVFLAQEIPCPSTLDEIRRTVVFVFGRTAKPEGRSPLKVK